MGANDLEDSKRIIQNEMQRKLGKGIQEKKKNIKNAGGAGDMVSWKEAPCLVHAPMLTHWNIHTHT